MCNVSRKKYPEKETCEHKVSILKNSKCTMEVSYKCNMFTTYVQYTVLHEQNAN
jgi:hypothetical protein